MLPLDREEKHGWRHAGDIPAPDIDTIRLWLTPWLGHRTLVGSELMTGGLMNRNCRLRFDTGTDVVLRIYDRDASAAGVEIAVLQRIRDTLPVPAVLHAELEASAEHPPFAILELVDGIAIREVKRSGDMAAIAEAAYDTGRLLATLQHYRFDRSGLLTPSLTVDTTRLPDPLTTPALVEHFARSEAFRARVDAALLAELRRIARDWDDHPRAPMLPTTLVHADFNSRNILVTNTDGRWRVSAILDWEFAFAGPAYVDIGNLLRYERPDRPRFEPAFSRGLREGGLPLEGDWLHAARMADLPALCELLSRPSTPDDVADEVLQLVRQTVDPD